jgi:hypothetical protein
MKRLILLAVFASSCLSARHLVKDRAVFYTEEEVNSTIFGHRVDVYEGKRSEIFKIDGEVVERDLYHQNIVEADVAERERERTQEEERRLEAYTFQAEAQEVIMKKLLSQHVQEMQAMYTNLMRYSLEEFFVFRDATISGFDEYRYIFHDLVPRALSCIEETNEGASYSDLRVLHDEIAEYVDRVVLFWRDTINNAIKNCDDTKKLKDLLTLVS